MIQITINQFEEVLPFVGASTEDVFDKMQDALEDTYNDLVDTVISPDCETAAVGDGTGTLPDRIRKYTILATFLLRLRSNDLIMTDNGFGVVANDNISPASQARVDALEKELAYKRDRVLSDVLSEMRLIEGWADTAQASASICSFLWSPKLLRLYSSLRGNLTYDDLAAHRTEIYGTEMMLRWQFSDSLIEQLLDEERRAQYEPSHRQAIVKMCHFIGANVEVDGVPSDRKLKEKTFQNLAAFIEENSENFPKYTNSSAYKAHHMKTYENKTEDSTFFFGG